jgi:hypothetical protein
VDIAKHVPEREVVIQVRGELRRQDGRALRANRTGELGGRARTDQYRPVPVV